MNNGVARLFVQALAEHARVEGMKVENAGRASSNLAPAYGEDDFNHSANRLEEISRDMGDAANYKD